MTGVPVVLFTKQMIDQTLRVGPFDEEVRRAGLLDRVDRFGARLHRQTEDLNKRQLATNAPRRFDTIHIGH